VQHDETGPGKSNPPGKAAEPFVTSVTASRGGERFLANVPDGPLGTFVRTRLDRRSGLGPGMLELEPIRKGVESAGIDDDRSAIACLPVTMPAP